jgi:hypothetical protein
MAGELAPELERYCERAGMSPEEPHRMALVALGRGVDGMDGKIARIGTEAATKAADGAMSVVRSEIRRTLQATHAFRVALYVAVPVVTLALGFWVGARQAVPTNFGPLSLEAVRLFQGNDLDAAVRSCVAQPPQGGREWCKMPMWRPQAPPA